MKGNEGVEKYAGGVEGEGRGGEEAAGACEWLRRQFFSQIRKTLIFLLKKQKRIFRIILQTELCMNTADCYNNWPLEVQTRRVSLKPSPTQKYDSCSIFYLCRPCKCHTQLFHLTSLLGLNIGVSYSISNVVARVRVILLPLPKTSVTSLTLHGCLVSTPEKNIYKFIRHVSYNVDFPDGLLKAGHVPQSPRLWKCNKPSLSRCCLSVR